jgi:predicted AlkP superfamily pyrophosphatase or phosphodiesterase
MMRRSNIAFQYVGYPWNRGNEQIFGSVKKHFQNHNSSVIFAYIDEIDHAEHKYGVHSKDFIEKLRIFDELCARFIRKIRDNENGKLSITVFSDHGMRDVDGTINIKEILDSTDLEIEKDYLLFLDSTIARFWAFNKNAYRRLIEALSGIKGGRILNNEEIVKYKINFKSNIYGDLQYLANAGKIILPNFYTIRGGTVKAMHGWDPDDKTQDSFIFTNQSPQNEELDDVTKIFNILQESLKVK